MRTFFSLSHAALALAACVTTAAVCAANEYDSAGTNRPVMTVTAGQGGYVRLPDLRPAQPAYSLTGERSDNQRTLRNWERQAGPQFRVGNSWIILPASR